MDSINKMTLCTKMLDRVKRRQYTSAVSKHISNIYELTNNGIRSHIDSVAAKAHRTRSQEYYSLAYNLAKLGFLDESAKYRNLGDQDRFKVELLSEDKVLPNDVPIPTED